MTPCLSNPPNLSKQAITLAARREERVAGERRPAGWSRRERELGGAPGKRRRPLAGVLWFVDCAGEREAAAAVQAAAMEEAIGGAGGRRQEAVDRKQREERLPFCLFINKHKQNQFGFWNFLGLKLVLLFLVVLVPGFIHFLFLTQKKWSFFFWWSWFQASSIYQDHPQFPVMHVVHCTPHNLYVVLYVASN